MANGANVKAARGLGGGVAVLLPDWDEGEVTRVDVVARMSPVALGELAREFPQAMDVLRQLTFPGGSL